MIKIPEKVLKPLDYIYVLRPSLFFAVWIITLAGYEASHLFYTGQSTWFKTSLDFSALFIFTLITLASGALFIFNQLQDVESDKENKKCFLISEDHVKPEFAKKYGLILAIVPLLIFLFIDFKIFILMMILELLWGYLYNYPPFRWKDKPIMGVLTNLMAGVILFLVGWQMNGEIVIPSLYKFLPYLCAWGAVSILTTVPDMAGDEKQTKNTIALWLGVQKTVIITLVLVIIGFVLGMKESDPVITHAILLSSPLYVITAFRPTKIWVLRTIRYSILFLAIFLVVEYPYFIIALGINYYLSRFYYMNRFNLEYPTLSVHEEDNENGQDQ
ncbi:MAG: UbiA family prenyltransferase [Fidelibacterota bacterium]